MGERSLINMSSFLFILLWSMQSLISAIITLFDWTSNHIWPKLNQFTTISTDLYELSSSSSSSANNIHCHTPLNLTSKSSTKTSSDDYDGSKQPSTMKLDNLPTELVILISNMAGFTSALKLGMTCKRFRNIIMNPLSWHDYAIYSPDIVDTIVSVTAGMDAYDTFLFGMWPREIKVYEPEVIRQNRERLSVGDQQVMNTQSNTSLRDDGKTFKQRLFFEYWTNHNASRLFGVEVDVGDDGNIDTNFFSRLEDLPCQQILPPEDTDYRSTHICNYCYSHKHRKIIKKISIYSPRHRVMSEGTFILNPDNPEFEWIWESPSNSRRVVIRFNHTENMMRVSNRRLVPFIVGADVAVNGIQLHGKLWNLWNRLVECRNNQV